MSEVRETPLIPTQLGRAFALPPGVLRLLEAMSSQGERGFLCGGTARDFLRGTVPRDLDVTSAATPSKLRRTLPPHWFATEQPGEEFGTLQLRIHGASIELTTLREERGYSDARRPDRVWFTDDITRDARRRDFTVNALYVDPLRGTRVDPTGGCIDLRDGRLRCVGDPLLRLREDPLRILRAVRQCVEHGFVMDRATWEALCATAADVAKLSGTRVRTELQKVFVSPQRARGLMLLVSSGIARSLLALLPELADVPQPEQFHPEGDVLRHTALVLAFLREPVDPALAWAAVFHDVGKKETFVVGPDRIRFDGHDRKSAEHARSWLQERGAPNALTDEVVEIVDEHIRIASVPLFRPAKRNRFLVAPLFRKHLEFHRADVLACHGKLAIYDQLRAAAEALPPAPQEPLLRGRDLIAAGVTPGPEIGRLLAAVEDARLAGEVHTSEEALAVVERLRRTSSI